MTLCIWHERSLTFANKAFLCAPVPVAVIYNLLFAVQSFVYGIHAGFASEMLTIAVFNAWEVGNTFCGFT